MVGLAGARAMLGGISERLSNPTPILEASMRMMEVAEANLFDSLAPHFVKKGDVRASLTEPDARGAIREIHGMEAKFGTSIWYSKFLRKVDGPSGKPRGRKRVGPNLVLKIRAQDRRAAVKALGRYLVRGV